MRFSAATFPPCCLKTGESFQGQPTKVTVEWVPHGSMWMFAFGTIGYTLAKWISGKKYPLALPISEAWLAKRRRTFIIGWSIVAGGAATLLLSIFGLVWAEINQVAEIQLLVSILVVSAGLVTIGGLLFLAFANQSLVQLTKAKDDYLWLKGIHPEYLNQLPDWESISP